jgi:hypothetical protein
MRGFVRVSIKVEGGDMMLDLAWQMLNYAEVLVISRKLHKKSISDVGFGAFNACCFP